MNIGRLRIAHPFTQAPLEEHSNICFRALMKRHGASLVVSERIDADRLAAGDRRALRTLATQTGQSPCAGQISGSTPAVMADAAKVVESLGYDIVDLNFDCPVRRLLARGEGGALMSDPAAIGKIVEAVCRAVSVPVTLKIRSGPDAEHETAGEVAKIAEAAGAAAVSVHARSVAQAYAGGPDWNVIARVKQSVAIPVLGGGGVRSAADAVALLRTTGADGVAIGRGCLGNPWIFAQARSLWTSGRESPGPSSQERIRAMTQLIEDEFHFYGAAVALRRLPRTSCYFAKFLPKFDDFSKAVRGVRNLAEFKRLTQQFWR